MYKPTNFSIQELVPPEELTRFGEDLCWSFLDPRMLVTLQTIRNRHGRLRVNSSALNFTQRGLRGEGFVQQSSGNTQTAKLWSYVRSGSAHKRGQAFDADPLDSTLVAIHNDIRTNPDFYPFLSFVEVDVNWLHCDVRNAENITFWSPRRGVVDVIKRSSFDWSVFVK